MQSITQFAQQESGNTGFDARTHSRRTALWSAYLDTGAAAFACVVLNLSEGGAMIQIAAPLAPKQRVALVTEHFGAIPGEVAWRLADKGKVGIHFDEILASVCSMGGQRKP
jgi:LDH2 family malate/lactate/ureidoglycolate dehydrogenase